MFRGSQVHNPHSSSLDSDYVPFDPNIIILYKKSCNSSTFNIYFIDVDASDIQVDHKSARTYGAVAKW